MSLTDLLAPVNVVVFRFGRDAVSVAELLGFVTGAACVWLTVCERVSNFPVGIANSAFFLALFVSARLFADAALQVVYIALGFAGWWQWLYGGEHRSALTISRTAWHTRALLALALAVATWGLTALLRHANDVAPFWDALTTTLSLPRSGCSTPRSSRTGWCGSWRTASTSRCTPPSTCT